MKKYKTSYLLILILMVSLSSCNNDDGTSSFGINSNNSFLPVSFIVGFSGQTHAANNVGAVISDGEIAISAIKGLDNETFTITISGNTIGSYPTNESVILYTSGVGEPTYSSINPADALTNTGQIVITSINTINKRISGRFEYTGYYREGLITYTKEFTNGTFKNVPYVSN